MNQYDIDFKQGYGTADTEWLEKIDKIISKLQDGEHERGGGMNSYDSRELLDTLETARIYAGAEFERLCNNNQHIDACVFQSIRDSIAQNIQLLQSYVISKIESEAEGGLND